MTLFVLIALFLTLLVVWMAVRPLLLSFSTQAARQIDGDNANLTFLRSRLIELEQQYATGKLDSDQFAALKEELEANLALEMDSSTNIRQHREDGAAQQAVGHNSLARRVALVLLICVPLTSAAVYWWVGSPRVISLMAQSAAEPPPFDIAEVAAMVAQIETRLDANPDDLEGWSVLSRTYLGLGRYADAERAYLQVLRLGGASAGVFAALADASALNAQGQLSGKPMEYVSQALELDPEHPQALWLAGLHAAQMGDNATAKRYWSILLPLLTSMPERQAELRDILAQMEDETLLTAPEPTESSTAPETPSQANSNIRLSVTIDAALLPQIAPQTLVFVIARAIDGPRAPLAVKRYTVATLPQEIELSDRDSMLAELQLSQFDNIEISARVSLSGQPIASPGDFQATPVRVNRESGAPIKLHIDQEVK